MEVEKMTQVPIDSRAHAQLEHVPQHERTTVATAFGRPPRRPSLSTVITKRRPSAWERVVLTFDVLRSAGTLSWTTTTPLPEPRWGGNAFALLDKLWVVGGFRGDGTLADIDVFDPGTGLWSTVPYPFSYFGQAFVATPDGMLVAVGGLQDCQSLATPVEQYDPSTGTVVQRAGLPTACYKPGIAASSDGAIYVFGGCLPPSSDPGGPPSAILDTVQRYDPQADTWSTRRAMPGPRYQCAAVTGTDGKIYLIGGTDGDVELNRVDVYHPAANTWQAVAPMPTARRCLAAVLGPDGHIYAIGGLADVASMATVEKYDPVTDTWTSCAPLSVGRWYLGAAVLGQAIYACGGFQRVGPCQADNANVTALAIVDEGTI